MKSIADSLIKKPDKPLATVGKGKKRERDRERTQSINITYGRKDIITDRYRH